MWDVAQESSFESIKEVMATAPTWAIYGSSHDTSSYGLGCALFQEQESNVFEPVVFASRTLSDTEQKYAPLKKKHWVLLGQR